MTAEGSNTNAWGRLTRVDNLDQTNNVKFSELFTYWQAGTVAELWGHGCLEVGWRLVLISPQCPPTFHLQRTM